MHGAERDEKGFILAQQDLFVVARDQRRTVDDGPMLGAVKVLLQ